MSGDCHTDKVRYLTRRAARRAARRARHEGRVTAYLCSSCGFWHLGHLGVLVTSGTLSRRQRFGL